MKERGEISFSRKENDTLLIELTGNWRLDGILPPVDEALNEVMSGPGVRQVSFDSRELRGWDSGLLTFLMKLAEECTVRNIRVEKDALPQGVQRFMDLTHGVPDAAQDARPYAGDALSLPICESNWAFWEALWWEIAGAIKDLSK
jgi:phospholipid/cholesterol/gamma-HCH transport system permease protein